MPVKKYDTIEQKEEAYRISSKKCYWNKKGEDWQKKSDLKIAKRELKEFLKNDDNCQKLYDIFISMKLKDFDSK